MKNIPLFIGFICLGLTTAAKIKATLIMADHPYNEFLAGTRTLTIMAIAGHKTEKSFLRYIRLTSSEHTKLLKGHWDERKTKALSVA